MRFIDSVILCLHEATGMKKSHLQCVIANSALISIGRTENAEGGRPVPIFLSGSNSLIETQSNDDNFFEKPSTKTMSHFDSAQRDIVFVPLL